MSARREMGLRFGLGLGLGLSIAGCDSNSGTGAARPLPPPPPPGAAAAAAAGAAGAGAAATEETGRSKVLAELRGRKWKADDFIESESNRDPFRSFLSDFAGGPTLETAQYEIYLSKFSLDELKLAMITSPRGGAARLGNFKRAKSDPECDTRACAMFVDGTGNGVTVSRNFHISKSDARVVRIDPEKGQVYVELKEDLGNGKTRLIERVLEMHPNAEGQNQ